MSDSGTFQMTDMPMRRPVHRPGGGRPLRADAGLYQQWFEWCIDQVARRYGIGGLTVFRVLECFEQAVGFRPSRTTFAKCMGGRFEEVIASRFCVMESEDATSYVKQLLLYAPLEVRQEVGRHLMRVLTLEGGQMSLPNSVIAVLVGIDENLVADEKSV